MKFEYDIPTRLLFGAGELERLADIELPGDKALIVISSGKSMLSNGYLERVEMLLSRQGVDTIVFDKVLPNPIKSHVMEGAALAKREYCNFIIGLGGGSSIDTAKSIAMMVNGEGDYWDYISTGTGGGRAITQQVLPIIAIPTTAGTGTEVDPWSVITNEYTNEKIGFGTHQMFPKYAIVDPELMLTVPDELTAYQGFDVICHSIEGYISNNANPISDIYALKSIELISKYLPIAVHYGESIKAREKVAFANTLAGMVESTSSCTSCHSMEHALSAFHPNLPHGAGLILLMEPYYELFIDKAPKKFARLAEVMGENIYGLSKKEAANVFLTAVKKLKIGCKVSQLKMSDFGILKEDIPAMAKNAMDTMPGLFQADCYQLSLTEVIQIMEKAYQ